ncbi:MAG: DUF2220 family protein [Ilumatobacteraceae bacterium]
MRAWARELQGAGSIRVVSTVRGARSIGRNELPGEVWVDDLASAAALLGTTAAVERFGQLVELTSQCQPALVGWLATRSIDALAVADEWPRLLAVVDWIQAHPRPRIYVRQVDLAGVDTKFVERHARLLSRLLDIVLPADAIDGSQSRFEARYGFRVVPETIRLRALDPALAVVAGSGDRPVTVTLDDFARLAGVERVFITENHVNFLAFPAAAGSIVVFGEGYDVAKVAAAPWVPGVPVHYWGDVDTHGFAILDVLRSKLPHVRSMLMDHATLHAHEARWGLEAVQVRRELPQPHARRTRPLRRSARQPHPGQPATRTGAHPLPPRPGRRHERARRLRHVTARLVTPGGSAAATVVMP